MQYKYRNYLVFYMAYFLPDQDEDSGGGSGERLSSWLGEEQGGTDSTLFRWSQTIQGT